MLVFNRLFQNVMLQMRDLTGLNIGVIDKNGDVVACSDQNLMGVEFSKIADQLNENVGAVITTDKYMIRSFDLSKNPFEYAVFVEGVGKNAEIIASMASVTLNNLKAQHERRRDKSSFIKDILSNNLLQVEVNARTREMHFPDNIKYALFLVRSKTMSAQDVLNCLSETFADPQNDFAVQGEGNDVVLVKLFQKASDSELNDIAVQILNCFPELHRGSITVGIGTPADHINFIPKSYKDARINIEVNTIFSPERQIIGYDELGIGRLIYQLPVTMCEKFLNEVFKKAPLESLDQELILTIDQYFENSLTVSETARKLFVHRNTLVYRLEKIEKLTGLNLADFDDAITFKVAMMVKKYLASRGIE